MDTLFKFSKLITRMENLTDEESETFVYLWNGFFGNTLGKFIESPAEVYALCSAEAE